MLPKIAFNDMFQGVTGPVNIIAFVDIVDRDNYNKVKSLLRSACRKPQSRLTALDKQNLIELFQLHGPRYPSKAMHMMQFEIDDEDSIEGIVANIKLAEMDVHRLIRYSRIEKGYIDILAPTSVKLEDFKNRLSNLYYDMNIYGDAAHDKAAWKDLIDKFPKFNVFNKAIKREIRKHKRLVSKFMSTIVKYPTT